ncbi:MAG: hypothetical protein N3G77_00905 [Nitrososphaeria archaeon]|nr:hypothetical protein [Nitrososphaeria archaeon]
MPLGSVVTEVLLAVVSIIIASTIAGIYISNMNQAADLQKLQLAKLKEDIEYGCKIIFAHGERSSTKLKLWVKNTGFRPLSSTLLDRSEIILITSDDVVYMLRGENSPSWTYSIINDVDRDGRWDPTETVEIDINLGTGLKRGDYVAKMFLFNGKSCEYQLSI